MDEELPTYTREAHGVDQDRDERTADTLERAGRYERSQRGRQALITQLNDHTGTLGEMVDYLRRKTSAKGDRPAGHIPRIVIYLRVSTEEQAKMGGEAEGYSIPYQRDACLAKVRTLGGILVEEYVDAGESAKSAHRPQLQAMLRELKAKRIDYVIVHKIDRLARNRADDVEINTQIARAGAKLISVAEPVDESPAGKLLYNMMADVAQYHSDNLAVEVLKGMDTKARQGGTPFRAPIGYLNQKEFVDNVRHSYIIIDPERSPLIRWAFETYALGDWSVARLTDALNAQGLRTRSTRKRPAKPLALNYVHRMLRNPYYMGVVPYRGVYHEGKHEALVSPELWLRVQDVLSAHFVSGEKDRVHHHYLKGSIFCGGCGARLVYSRNRGRGGVYEYYTCVTRLTKRKPCSRPRYIRLDKIEAAVDRFYQGFEVRPERATSIRAGVVAELNADREQAARDRARAAKRIRDIEGQQAKLLQAHYAGAVPLTLLKSEMDRFTRELSDARLAAEAAIRSVTDLEAVLDGALEVAANCARAYLDAKEQPAVRRLFNQGFFKALYVDEDGEVERCELTEPFATLLDPELLDDLGDTSAVPGAGDEEVQKQLETTGRGSTAMDAENERTRPLAVFARRIARPAGRWTDGFVRLGSNKVTLVRVKGL